MRIGFLNCRYAQTVNESFAKIIGLQFAVSMLVVCANLYKLAMMTIAAELIILILYTACILAQIFLYCWFGNELKLKVNVQFLSKVIKTASIQIFVQSTKILCNNYESDSKLHSKERYVLLTSMLRCAFICRVSHYRTACTI